MSVLNRFEKVRRESSFDKQAELDEIFSDAKGYRESVAERVLSVDQGYTLDIHGNSKGVRRFTWGLRLFAFVLSVMVVFFPEANNLASWLAVAFIPAVIFISFFKRDTFVLLEKRAPCNKVNLFGPFMSVSTALCLNGLFYYPGTGYNEELLRCLILIACIALVVIAFLFFSIKVAGLGAVTVVSLFLSFFLLIAVNSIPPFSEEVHYHGNISRKHTNYRSPPTIYIQMPNDKIVVYVSRSQYDKYQVGDLACAYQKTGRLGLIVRRATTCDI